MPQANGTTPADALDSVDYDPIDHLNALFSHSSTLSTVPKVSAALRRHQDELDRDINSLVRVQTTTDSDSVRRIQDAKSELEELFAKIEGVRERALETERAITEMTADIKRLDSTKKNLTLSMTALKRLQMLTTAYEQLRGLSQSRQYRECAHLLQAVIQLMAHFKSYRSIDQIAALSKNVADVQRELLEQVCEDFEVTFARGEVQQKRSMLAEACLVMDALGDQARSRLVTWYCNTQLREYRQVFRGNDEAGSLDNIARRYSWFNRMLKTYDAEHAMLFPASWRVNEMLANAFCETTRDDYKGILQRSMRRTDGQPPDVNLLLSCLQETLDFEHSLEKRFAAGESRSSMDTVTSSEEKRHGFSQAISEAFEPYLSIWVESQDKQLATLIPKYRQQPIKPPDEEFNSQLVIPSSTELFHQYRVTLAQCAKLSTGSRLLELSRTFGKYLDAYAQQVLFYHLADKTSGPSVEGAVIILNTADYCFTTTSQLEEKIKSRVDEELREKVDMQSQADAFMGVAAAAVRALVHKTEIDCEPAWREMRAVPWSRMENVGDQSSYVSVLLQRVKDRSREILKCLHKPQYARAYCDNLVDSLTNTYIVNIAASKPISETGAEQMLLDSYVLKKGFAELATLNAEPGTPPNAAFVKRVTQTTAKLDPLLKTLQVRASPPEGLVQAYLIHIRDRSELNFRKILDLKGITRKPEQHPLIELFNAHKASPSNESLPASNPLIAGLQLTVQTAAATGGLAALKDNAIASSTPSLPARFDPANFGTALMNAARDAGDRIASPHLGVGGSGAMTTQTASRTTSPPPAGGDGLGINGDGERVPVASLNENLKSFGKFFRRDVGSFGGFGKKDDSRRSLERR
ncbi:Vacuolar protein sorting-associated protein 53 [Elasticomyces elasticus]|nr:Vacuolar protein sorting-associated protein 53 [Elasticomyces elasticus]KAK3657103.1 Vacuolar protein sorting-associated protein 53 [Elasticomyces elasticus]KAK5762381.1 Vacuolar protein sorting-associated protein 53 [Elasticomyces elasticus]